MTFIPWYNTDLYPIKRALSRFEKSSLHSGHQIHRALVLPGSPGGEVEELIEVGFDTRQIIAVERDRELANTLFTHYVDDVQVIHAELHDVIRYLRGTYSYVHLDFCGMLNDDEMYCIDQLRNVVASQARLRVTLTRARKAPAMEQRERDLYHDLLGALIYSARNVDVAHHQTRWVDVYERLFDNAFDATALVGAMFVVNYFFGMSVTSFLERDASTFPMPTDQFSMITAVNRYAYNEPRSKTPMSTIYVDVERWPLLSSGHVQAWVLDRLHMMCELIARPIAQFSI